MEYKILLNGNKKKLGFKNYNQVISDLRFKLYISVILNNL